MDARDNAEGVTEPKSETSPLKENKVKSCFLWNFFCNFETDFSGSLKTIIVSLFGTSAGISLALLAQVYYGEYEVKPHGIVVSDRDECSKIGMEVLKNGGNAVDASISAAVCLGVVHFHVTGLGGGGYLMLYNHKQHKVNDVIDFREMIPQSYRIGELSVNTSNNGVTVGVPGFLKGMWVAHEKHGKVPWKNVIMPSAILARNGFKISDESLAAAAFIKSNSYNGNLRHLIKSLEKGQKIALPSLAITLETIALKGAEEFYKGEIAASIVYSVKLAHGNMSLNDLSKYKILKSSVKKTKFSDFSVYVPSSSSGGSILLKSLDSIEILDLNEEIDSPAEIILKTSDVMQDAYLSILKKTEASFEQPGFAASQVSVVDSEENYVTIVSGLGTWFGSQILTDTGFILNNALVRGGINENGRPISFASPILAIEDTEVCGKRFVLGSGDVTAAAQVLTNLLIFNKNISESIESPRFTIYNKPRHIRLEEFHVPKFSHSTVELLKQHANVEKLSPPYTSINVIEKVFDYTYSYADSRGGGGAAEY